MAHAPYNILFFSAANSARSIIAEALAAQYGGRRFRTYSAGCTPKGEVHPRALEILRERGVDTGGLRSKSWDEFKGPDAPKLDFAFTICDLDVAEACPMWPGGLTGHWGIETLEAATETAEAQRRLFERVYAELEGRIKLFMARKPRELDLLSLRRGARPTQQSRLLSILSWTSSK
jgi:arsenate reductase